MEGTARVKTYDRLLLGCGLLIPLWLLAGVWLTALAYPGYDHFQQAMSQLSAVGSPVQRWSPWVNNYPLAVLFILSGLLMFFSLTLASALWAWLRTRLAGSQAVALLSATSLILAIVTVALMAQAAQSGQLFGLYQRLNYGVSVPWIACLAWASLRNPAARSLHRPNR
nr:DUF998 domain-containing protein [Pseudomonas juntendi]